MTLALCIASRGRPEELRKTVASAKKGAVVPGTHVCVALDLDDESIGHYPAGSINSIDIREDSLGAKYNRAASLADPDATLFVLGVDDAFPSSPGWDRILLNAAQTFDDGVGVIYFGERKGAFGLPDGIAVTKGWIEQVGFFCPEYFPFWWHDTWIDELARMTGRFVWADVKWQKHGASEVGGHKTTRMRDVAWWAKAFDDLRGERVGTAKRMLETLTYPDWLRSQLLSELPNVCGLLEQRNNKVRALASEFEGEYGAERMRDTAHERLKRKVEERLGRGR